MVRDKGGLERTRSTPFDPLKTGNFTRRWYSVTLLGIVDMKVTIALAHI